MICTAHQILLNIIMCNLKCISIHDNAHDADVSVANVMLTNQIHRVCTLVRSRWTFQS
jgi:hypothetical protein